MTDRRTMGLALLAVACVLLAPDRMVSQVQQANLVITDAGSGKYLVEVHGLGPANADVRIRGFGDDLFFDDHLFEFAGTHSLTGGEFIVSAPFPRRILNEDWGRDEVYAIADVGSVSIRTNTIRRSF